MIDIIVIIYLDNILIYSDNISKHKAHIWEVLCRFCANRLFAHADKCKFHVTSCKYLGYMLSPEGLTMVPYKVQIIQDWPVPWKVKDIQSFLSFSNFYCCFIHGYCHDPFSVLSPFCSDWPIHIRFTPIPPHLLYRHPLSVLILTDLVPHFPWSQPAPHPEYSLERVPTSAGDDANPFGHMSIMWWMHNQTSHPHCLISQPGSWWFQPLISFYSCWYYLLTYFWLSHRGYTCTHFQFNSNSIPNMSPVLWELFLIVLGMQLFKTMIVHL